MRPPSRHVALLRDGLRARGWRVEIPRTTDAAPDLVVSAPGGSVVPPAGLVCGDGGRRDGGLCVRDRESVVPDALEARGWRLLHTSAVDWLRDPEGELDRLCARLAEAARPGVPERPAG